MNRTLFSVGLGVLWACLAGGNAWSQEPPAGPMPVRGSLVEDRAAKKLLEAGDARLDADEASKAVEVWQSVIERYPRSKVRFEAHLRLGNYLLERERAHDRARTHFEAVAAEDNRDDEQRADATLKMGVCFYEARNYGMCFKVMREVVEKFPVSKQVNQAYYYIGLGHFQLGHYSRAIQALEKVGTALAENDKSGEKLEAGKRLFVKIEDADLAVLNAEDKIEIRVKTTQGDTEKLPCYPVGRNVRVVLGSIVTALGKPAADDGILQVRGDDKVQVVYVDSQRADKSADIPVQRDIQVVGTARVDVTDGAFEETLQGVALDRGINVQIHDPDRDLTDQADALKALIGVYREKTNEELQAEAAAKLAEGGGGEGADVQSILEKLDKFKQIDSVEATLAEVKLAPARQPSEPAAEENPAQAPAAPAEAPVAKPAADESTHSGTFRTVVTLARAEMPVAGDAVLQAMPNDVIRVVYLDEINFGDGPRTLTSAVQVIEGNLGGVRVTQARISDQELRVRTQLKTASALTNIGNRYKEFGLTKNAASKYEQALIVCDEIHKEAAKLGGRLLEETYVQLWQIYFAMDKLELAAAMAQRLQAEFPNSGFVDEAMLQLADVARKQGNLQRAIGLYSRLVSLPNSQLRGEAQFGVAECYDAMAAQAEGPGAAQMRDRAFQEYKKVFDQFPESGRVGEAVAKMADYYYEQKDYARAVDIFETVLAEHPDAKFLDVILYNYGRCLYRMNRKNEAEKQFNQLIAEFPESPLAEGAKRIAEALGKQAPEPSAGGN